MLAAQRRDLLLERLRVHGRIVAKDLAVELGISEDSIRRDLRELAAAGLCQRVYGGALPVSPAIADYYLRLTPGLDLREGQSRLTMLSCRDASPVPLTEKILARPALVVISSRRGLVPAGPGAEVQGTIFPPCTSVVGPAALIWWRQVPFSIGRSLS